MSGEIVSLQAKCNTFSDKKQTNKTDKNTKKPALLSGSAEIYAEVHSRKQKLNRVICM